MRSEVVDRASRKLYHRNIILSLGFPTRSDTNQAIQLQNMARGLKFQIWEVEGLYYLCRENKGADQQVFSFFISEIPMPSLASVAEQSGLYRTLSEAMMRGFLATSLRLKLSLNYL